MSERLPEPASGADAFGAPVTGTFHSSWRVVLKEAAWVAVPVLLLFGVLGWLDRDFPGLAIGAASALVWTGLLAAVYRVWGAHSVEITPEALTVTKRGRRPERVVWADLRDANYRTGQGGNSWVFRHGHRRTVVPERGFTLDDWLAVCRGIHDWKASGPLATLPGVDTRRQRREGIVFSAHQPPALFWGIPFFALCGAVGLLSSWEAYRDGSWPADLMLSVGLPVFGFGFVALGALGLTRAVKRVTFGPRAMTVERYVGASRTVPYADVTDGWDARLQARQGTFSLGDRNLDTFWRLLDERLGEEQLAGEIAFQHATQASTLWVQLVALLVLPIAAGVVGWWAGLGTGNVIALAIAFLIAASISYSLWTRRRARRWMEEFERDAEPPEASGA